MSITNLNSEILIDNFIDELWLEKGLSKNTLTAYRNDIQTFSNWYKGNSLLEVERVDLLDYLADRLKQGFSSRSTARSLSSLRAFYSHLTVRHNLKEDPTSRVESPKLGKSLPKTLSEEEVERLIQAPDVDDDIGGAELCNIRFSLAYGGKILLHQTKLKLRRGHRYALVGQNGAGKTTLMTAINVSFLFCYVSSFLLLCVCRFFFQMEM